MPGPVHQGAVVAGQPGAGSHDVVIRDVPAGQLVVAWSTRFTSPPGFIDSQGNAYAVLVDESVSRGIWLYGSILTNGLVNDVDWIETPNGSFVGANAFSGLPANTIANAYAQDATATTESFSTPTIKAGDLALLMAGNIGNAGTKPEDDGWTDMQAPVGGFQVLFTVLGSDGPKGPYVSDGHIFCVLPGFHGGGATMFM